jgi:hypothetical protein
MPLAVGCISVKTWALVQLQKNLGGAEILENGQIKLAKALRVGDDFGQNGLSFGHCEAEYAGQFLRRRR